MRQPEQEGRRPPWTPRKRCCRRPSRKPKGTRRGYRPCRRCSDWDGGPHPTVPHTRPCPGIERGGCRKLTAAGGPEPTAPRGRFKEEAALSEPDPASTTSTATGYTVQSVSQSDLFHGPAPCSPLHRLSIRLRHSRPNTSTEYSLPGATQLLQVRSISPSG